MNNKGLRAVVKGTLIHKGDVSWTGVQTTSTKHPSYRKKVSKRSIIVETKQGVQMHSTHWGKTFEGVMLGDDIEFSATVRGAGKRFTFSNPRSLDVKKRMHDIVKAMPESALKKRLLRIHTRPLRQYKYAADMPEIAYRKLSK